MNSFTAVFDIGKTNKKFLLFDLRGNPVYEWSENFPETVDDENFPSENISLLTEWISEKWKEISSKSDFRIDSLNFTSYGASFVYLDKNDQVCSPLYNYLKPYPPYLLKEFYARHGNERLFSLITGSPSLGMLNSGLQLFWLKNLKPEIFQRVKACLHLPQYLSFLFSGRKISEFTSIGCHTGLWDFPEKNYHEWVYKEEIIKILPPLFRNSIVGSIKMNNYSVAVGAGLHDSSAALIPYKKEFKESFLLLSTGTWCVALNPFNKTDLTWKELAMDCLNFFSPEGEPVRASRIFLGKEHDFQVQRIAEHFNKDQKYYKEIRFDKRLLGSLFNKILSDGSNPGKLKPLYIQRPGSSENKEHYREGNWDLAGFESFEEAYHQLLLDLTCMLKRSVLLIDKNGSNKLFVDGGFAHNQLFMNMLANHFHDKVVYSSEISQSTALGAAIHVNKKIQDLNWKLAIYLPSESTRFFTAYYEAHYAMDHNV